MVVMEEAVMLICVEVGIVLVSGGNDGVNWLLDEEKWSQRMGETLLLYNDCKTTCSLLDCN